jgi:DNA (cytosine-5)-methyltransferase 1
MNNIVIFSFFSGSGFLDLGFEKSGYKIELVNEFSTSFINAYKYSREKMGHRIPKYGYQNFDINEYLTSKNKEIKSYVKAEKSSNNIVGFIGGPPCPDFSVGGKNRGRDGENGKLSLSYIKLICKQKPDFFLFENVKGLWRTARHRAFYEELKEMLHVAGYITTERLTNALEFGVPQDRDRILMFGIRKGLLSKKSIYENTIIDFPWESHLKYNLDEIKQLPWPTVNAFNEDVATMREVRTPQELTIQYWFEKNDVYNHPNSNKYFVPRNGLAKMQSIEEGDVSKKSYKRLHRWRYSPTVAYGNNEVHLHPYKVRRLSASEALAIQSLPKNFEFPPKMSLSDTFKTIGNGVPFLLSEAIAETIKEYLELSYKIDDKK